MLLNLPEYWLGNRFLQKSSRIFGGAARVRGGEGENENGCGWLRTVNSLQQSLFPAVVDLAMLCLPLLLRNKSAVSLLLLHYRYYMYYVLPWYGRQGSLCTRSYT